MVQILEEFKEYIITGVISAITALFAYFMGQRKSKAETEVVETDVVKNIRELYGNLVSDLKDVVIELRETKKQVVALSTEVNILRHTAQELEKELEACRKVFKK